VIFYAFLLLLLCLIAGPDARACTVWAAAGDKVEGGGVIAAKNRDNTPGLSTVLKLLYPKQGYRVFALFDTEADGYITGGINEKGLVVLNAAAGSVSRQKRLVATEDLTERLLTTFDSVDAALAQSTLFSKSHPALYMLADSSKVVSVEVAPGGDTATHVVKDGTIAFSNHYTDKKISRANERISSSSKARLDRISYLLANHSSPMTKADFISISADRSGGPDHSLWRTGSTPGKVRTLASVVISLPKQGQAEVYVRLSGPGGVEATHRMKADEIFPSQTAK
jgi:isopenicillin-N N-acyltransferase-like protein